jgi:hypothetical protein
MKFPYYKDLSRHVVDHCPTCGQDTRPIILKKDTSAQDKKPETTQLIQPKQPTRPTQLKQPTQPKTTPWLYRDVDKLRSLHCYNTGKFLTYEEWKAFTGQDATDTSSADEDDETYYSC